MVILSTNPKDAGRETAEWCPRAHVTQFAASLGFRMADVTSGCAEGHHPSDVTYRTPTVRNQIAKQDVYAAESPRSRNNGKTST